MNYTHIRIREDLYKKIKVRAKREGRSAVKELEQIILRAGDKPSWLTGIDVIP